MTRRQVLLAYGAVILAVVTMVSLQASSVEASRTVYLTFNQPIGIPGVGLAPGTYVFELADPEADPSIVRVSSKDRSQVYFMGFTELIRRPAGVRADRPVSFGEASPGVPVPITVWYPTGDSTGRRFIYHRTGSQRAESTDR